MFLAGKIILSLFCLMLMADRTVGSDEKILIGDFSEGGMAVQSFLGSMLTGGGKLPDGLAVAVRRLPVNMAAAEDRADLFLDENLRPWDEQKFAVQDYALLPLTIAVSLENPLENISLEDLQRIYSGRVADWSRLGALSAEVKVGGDRRNSPAGRAFRSLVMKENIYSAAPLKASFEIVPGMLVLNNTASAAALLKAMPGLIVYGSWSLAAAAPGKYKILKINGVAPTLDNILSGRYPLVLKHSLRYRRDNPPEKLDEITAFLRDAAQKSGEFIAPVVKK